MSADAFIDGLAAGRNPRITAKAAEPDAAQLVDTLKARLFDQERLGVLPEGDSRDIELADQIEYLRQTLRAIIRERLGVGFKELEDVL